MRRMNKERTFIGRLIYLVDTIISKMFLLILQQSVLIMTCTSVIGQSCNNNFRIMIPYLTILYNISYYIVNMIDIVSINMTIL